MNILLVIPSLAIGGAEVFVVRLANGLSRRGHQVYLLHFNSNGASKHIVERVSDQVKVMALNHRLSLLQTIWWKLLYTVTNWNTDLRRKISFERKKIQANGLAAFLENFCQEKDIDVINSHLVVADWSVAKYFRKKMRRQKFVISMHGCYNHLGNIVNSSKKKLSIDEQKALETADHIILLTPKNAAPLGRVTLKNDPIFIPLGFENSEASKDSQAFDAEENLIFGLVARAEPEKGWKQAIVATRELNGEGISCRLVLVGDGQYRTEMQQQFGDLPYLHFVGASSQVLDWVRQFDVGLFPSYGEYESYPNTVIEYLACGKPVIGTNLGEVKNMMSAPDGRIAGMLLHYTPEGTSVQELAKCMRHYAENPHLLTEHSLVAGEAFQKFDMDLCLDAYEAAYK